jgi:carbonic anhydrase
MKRGSLTARWTAAVAWIIPLLAFSTHAADKPGLTPEEAWRCLKDGNERFAADRLEGKDVGSARRKELTAGQHPFAVVLSCADSRVPPEIIFNRGLGEIFVVRVAGNISEPFALGSIDYAIEHLHVPLIVVLGHEQCGAVAAALEKGKPAGNLGKLIGEIHVGEHLSANKNEALAGAVRNNARRQAELLTERSDVIRQHVKQKTLQIVVGVYSLANGKVQWLEAKEGSSNRRRVEDRSLSK